MLNTFQEGRSHIAVVAPILPAFKRQESRLALEQVAPEKQHGLLRALFRRTSSDEVRGAEEGENLKTTLKELPGGLESQSSLLTALVDSDRPVGIITIEDVIEELLNEEIFVSPLPRWIMLKADFGNRTSTIEDRTARAL